MPLPRLLLAAATLLAGCAAPAPDPAAAAPAATTLDPAARDVVLVTLDTTRADALTPYGAPPEVTPYLARFAEEAMLFERAYTEANVTNPSHLTMLSGLRPIEHGVVNNHAPAPVSLDTLALALDRAGYDTAAFLSTQHLQEMPGWRGFDVLPAVLGERDARATVDDALAYLQERSGGRHDPAPLFLWVHLFDAHMLYLATAEEVARFYDGMPTEGPRLLVDDPDLRPRQLADQGLRAWLGETRDPEYPRALYRAEVHRVDREVGRLLAALERRARADDTITVIVADHGESLGEHGISYAHAGLYEPQVRVPLMIRVPGLPAGRATPAVSILDLTPTLLELLGVDLRHPTTGTSLMPILTGSGELDSRPLIHQNAHNHAVAVQQDDWKLIWPIHPANDLVPSSPELYHLAVDPEERHNLFASEPERARRLRSVLTPWITLGRVGREDAAQLDVEVRERLRALGYLEG